MNWKDNFSEGKALVLSTCSKDAEPNANVVISLGFVDNKLLIADCQMKNTIKNLQENPKVCVVAGYFRLKGSVEIFSSGKYFDICVEKSKGYTVKNAIVVSVEEIFDLDKGKEVV
ncbi:pyridoxamine 5'-phosphate oxidase family protein [Candidatus Woesearchaeota archaeon]|nr:pyridoxamine 5'-phosphate oxidase family protein [Candidatus Woesearchaeota archaeon]